MDRLSPGHRLRQWHRQKFGGRLGTGNKGAVDQGLVQIGNERWVGGQEAGLGDPGGGGDEAVQGVRLHVPLHAAHLMDDAAGDVGAPEDGEVIALGVGGGDVAPDLLEDVVEQEEAPLLPDFPEAPVGPAHFDLDMVFMALEGRGVQAVFLAEGGQGEVFGEDGLVDFQVLGMVADGAFGHGWTP